MLVADRSG